MERQHLPVIRYRLYYLIVFLASWLAAGVFADVPNERSFGSWNVSAIPPSIRGIKCTLKEDDKKMTWSCRGDKLLQVPSNLTTVSTKDKMILKLEHAGIRKLSTNSLAPYAKILCELYLDHVPELDTLEPGIFQNITELHTIYIAHARRLTHIHDDVFNVHLPRLRSIRIIRTSLHKLPSLSNLVVRGRTMQMVDFENNHIDRIDTASIKIDSKNLYLSYNKISSIFRTAFNGSKFGRLSLKGNTELTNIHEDAFVGLKSIHSLDLSDTSITTLPTNGLQNIKELTIENTKTLKRFPSVYNFEAITTANLTYPYHCCAFMFPAKHDSKMFEKHEKSMKKMTENYAPKSRRCLENSVDEDNFFKGRHARLEKSTANASATIVIYDHTTRELENFTCYPKPDAFNPCEDIMGYWVLRIAVWFAAVLAIFGNLAVLIVLVFSGVEVTVPKFLMCNLAWADICMGIYLTLIASMDAASIGDYFNYAIDWQSGLGCKIAGFLTVFSTELSIFTLTIITCERWYTITYAVHMNKRLKLTTCIKIMAVGWIYSSVMAGLPIADISSYDKTSLCLPLENQDDADVLYLITLLVFNGLAFLTIVFCYSRMYSSIRFSRETVTPTARTDMTVAKRMALLVFVDFVCWAPIAFFAITALAGRLLITVPQLKILIVFFYPLNSCANPYLYALLTRQYRRDVFIFLARHGMCQKRAAKYKRAIAGCPTLTGNQMRLMNRSKTDNLQPPSTQNTTLSNSDVPAHNNDLTSASADNGCSGKTADVDNLHKADVHQEAASFSTQEKLSGEDQPDSEKLDISKGAVE